MELCEQVVHILHWGFLCLLMLDFMSASVVALETVLAW